MTRQLTSTLLGNADDLVETQMAARTYRAG